MKKVILIIALISACFISANAQKAVYDQNNNMTGIYDIIDTEALFPCSKEKFIGRLIAVLGEYPEHQIIIQTAKGKENLELNTATMPMVDRSNLFYSLLKKGKNLKVNALMCGSGAFLYATSIEATSAVRKSTKTRRKGKN